MPVRPSSSVTAVNRRGRNRELAERGARLRRAGLAGAGEEAAGGGRVVAVGAAEQVARQGLRGGVVGLKCRGRRPSGNQGWSVIALSV